MDPNIAHDFNDENKMIMVLGGFIVLKTTPCYYFLNVIFIACQFGLYAFLFIMALYTIYDTSDDKVTMIRAFHSLCLLLAGLLLQVQRYINGRYIHEATELIRNGIFKYFIKEPLEARKVLEMRIKHIRFGTSFFTKFLVSCAMIYAFLLPLVQRLTVDDKPEMVVNPYLPLSFYMPFNTRTYTGFLIAFFSNEAFYAFFFLAVLCAFLIYISCAVQLIAHIEVLNISLMNIEKRAVAELMRQNIMYDQNVEEGLYKKPAFQMCLYTCLRENILHHQAISRFTKAVSPFLEAVNGVALLFFSIIMASSVFLIIEEPRINIAVFMILVADTVCYFCMCFIGEIITEKSSETAISLYSTPWPHCDEKFKLLLKIMANYLKKPIILRSAGLSSVCNLETFGDMIAVGYKLLNVFR